MQNKKSSYHTVVKIITAVSVVFLPVLTFAAPLGSGGDPFFEDEHVSLSRRLNARPGFVGEFNHSFPLSILPGRNGFQPSAALSYSSQPGSNQSPFGYGWSFSVPSISRENKLGIDRMFEDRYFVSSLDGKLAAPQMKTFSVQR